MCIPIGFSCLCLETQLYVVGDNGFCSGCGRCVCRCCGGGSRSIGIFTPDTTDILPDLERHTKRMHFSSGIGTLSVSGYRVRLKVS